MPNRWHLRGHNINPALPIPIPIPKLWRELFRKWLRDWADYQFTEPKGFTGADNGALQIHLLKTVVPEAGVPSHFGCPLTD